MALSPPHCLLRRRVQVCHFASLDVSDMMGTERQGITKDIIMTRLDSDGKSLGVVDYTDDAITYEEIADTSLEEAPCTVGTGFPLPASQRSRLRTAQVTMYEHADFTGWEAAFAPGEYDHAKLETHGAMNDDVESVVVGKGCSAVIAQNGAWCRLLVCHALSLWPLRPFRRRA